MERKNKSRINCLHLNLKFFILILLSPAFISSGSGNQPAQTGDDKLNLIDQGKTIENSISLYTSKSNYQAVKAINGDKVNVKTEVLLINGDSVKAERINTRGQTTLYYTRKSFSFSLKSKVLFRHGERIESFKKFFAISLSMDRNYTNNRLAFEMMEICQLFSLFYSFCEFRINDHSEGIYMIIERPEDWAMKKKNSPLLIRRGYNHDIDKILTDKKTEKGDVRKYCSYFEQIYTCLNKYEGETLYKTLSDRLDIDFYMKWLAFNFLVRNGDYTDEVYFYFDPGINKFSIIPWDYDDIFFSAPHEGNIQNKKLLEGKLIFSAEDRLDSKIASDPFLHKMYLIQLKEVLNQLSPEVLKRVFENTYAELYPYYSKNEIINMSEYDAYKNANLVRLQNDMSSLYDMLRISRNQYMDFLKGAF
jgi:spore coat protein H